MILHDTPGCTSVLQYWWWKSENHKNWKSIKITEITNFLKGRVFNFWFHKAKKKLFAVYLYLLLIKTLIIELTRNQFFQVISKEECCCKSDLNKITKFWNEIMGIYTYIKIFFTRREGSLNISMLLVLNIITSHYIRNISKISNFYMIL